MGITPTFYTIPLILAVSHFPCPVFPELFKLEGQEAGRWRK